MQIDIRLATHKLSLIGNQSEFAISMSTWFWFKSCPSLWFIVNKGYFMRWFYGISIIVGYLMPNLFYTYKKFYFKQFSLPWVHSLFVKNISISSYYTQLNVKTVLFQTIQFSIQKTVPFQTILFSISTQFKCKNSSIVCLFGFYGISTLVGYLMPNPFLCK